MTKEAVTELGPPTGTPTRASKAQSVTCRLRTGRGTPTAGPGNFRGVPFSSATARRRRVESETGIADPPLTDYGREQARHLAEWLKDERLDHLVVSSHPAASPVVDPGGVSYRPSRATIAVGSVVRGTSDDAGSRAVPPTGQDRSSMRLFHGGDHR